MKPITPCLWFDGQAEQAAAFYVSVFPNSRLGAVSRFREEGFAIHGQPAGTVMTVAFEIDGQPFTALNGGPLFQFSEAVSFQIYCDTQQQIDDYWRKLTADGGEEGQCGWLKDRFGLSWQIVPEALERLMRDPDPARSGRVMNAMLQMKKLDIAALQKAYDG